MTVLSILTATGAEAQQEKNPSDAETGMLAVPDLPKFAIPTLGGKQFWGDEHVMGDWRIQRNVLTGHYRLLDDQDRRHAAGSLETCQQRLRRIADERSLSAPGGRVVVLLHGLGRTRGSLESLRDHLAKTEGWTVIGVGYPSTRSDVATHAESLQRILLGMPDVKKFDFVGHSMGNIVVRRYLAMLLADENNGDRQLAKIGRIVMMCPPNQGAVAAEKLGPVELSHLIGGPTLREIGQDWKKLEPTLATPPGEFGILAGGRGDGEGYNKLIPGDDDMVVSVDTTRLAGASDFRVIAAAHTFFMNNKTTHAYVQSYLQHGYFESDETRQPVSNPE